MSKERVGERGGIEAGDVDGDEGAGTLAGAVDACSHQFLAHAGFAKNEHGLGRGGNGFDIAEHAEHGGGAGDQAGEELRLADFGHVSNLYRRWRVWPAES